MSKVIWDNLKVIHEWTNLSIERSLLQKLYATKMSEDGDMDGTIAQMLESVDKLNQLAMK